MSHKPKGARHLQVRAPGEPPTRRPDRCRRAGAFAAEAGPALRRGALVAVPAAAAILLELVDGDDAIAGGLATTALFGGFLAFDAPAIIRARWQLLVAPLIGISAVLGVFSGTSTVFAVLALGVVGGIAAYGVAVSRGS